MVERDRNTRSTRGSFIPHVAPESSPGQAKGTLRLAYGWQVNQFADLRLPEEAGPHPVVALVHGGGWQSMYHLDLMDDLAAALTQEGYATWNIEYRAVGHKGGGWSGTFLDVGAALDQLRDVGLVYSLDLDRLVLLGHSAGGHLALWLAARHRLPLESPLRGASDPLWPTGVVAMAPAPDLEQVWRDPAKRFSSVVERLIGGTPTEVPERYREASPAKLLPLDVPQQLVHGTDDQSVPVTYSRDYARAARAAGDTVELHELGGIDHFALMYPRLSAWPAILQSVDALSGRS